MGFEKGQQGNHLDAISNFSKAIEINPRLEQAYYFRGISKTELIGHVKRTHDVALLQRLNPITH
jgi:hypothetical protein